jgi:lipoprotein-releasing system permease protein
MLVMVVTDKRTDIAILRTLGASPARIVGVFSAQGLVIGWAGVALGVVLGVTIAKNVDVIMPWLERTFGFQMWSSDVYYLTAVPSDVQWPMVAWIAFAALVLTGLATIYPSVRASRTAPAEALRYE